MRRLFVLVAAVAGYLLWVRPRLLRLGASSEEAAERLPGDDLLDTVDTQSTMATTIVAAPEDVWPWLAQMGCDRAGWYSWDGLDNPRRPSAERIVPDWQHLGVGDRIASTPSGSAYFTAAVVDPPSSLVLRADLSLAGQPCEAEGKTPSHASHSTGALVLRPTDNGETRLIVRTRSTGSRRVPSDHHHRLLGARARRHAAASVHEPPPPYRKA
jgi:hypothetical protein